MKSDYYPPKFKSAEFHCPFCRVFAHQVWENMFIHQRVATLLPIESSVCAHCQKRAYWIAGRMIFPDEAPIEPAHPDLPEECLQDYEEARSVFSRSPRAAAALLRLSLQKLMPHLGEAGKNINSDIKSLVSKGLPALVQKALDYCRVVGNNAVHPGEIDVNDTPDIAMKLFSMLNFIVEDRITRPKEILSLYSELPEDDRKTIDERDSKK